MLAQVRDTDAVCAACKRAIPFGKNPAMALTRHMLTCPGERRALVEQAMGRHPSTRVPS